MDDTHALGVFSTPEVAAEALALRYIRILYFEEGDKTRNKCFRTALLSFQIWIQHFRSTRILIRFRIQGFGDLKLKINYI